MEQTETRLDIRNPKAREQFFMELYEETFPKVAKFVAHREGSFQDAKDIFQDALVIFYEKLVNEKLDVQMAHEFYIVGIAKHVWLRKFKEDHNKVGLDEMEKAITIPEDYFEISETRLTRLLELAGRKCMNLLHAFYYDNLPLNKIMEAFGFSNVHSASVQKFKCIEKMRNTIQEKSMGYEDFK
jgi:DNA-directed RNA polymerase specialized sigma24 family protein